MIFLMTLIFFGFFVYLPEFKFTFDHVMMFSCICVSLYVFYVMQGPQV